MIVAYQPNTGCEQQLIDLVSQHVPLLRELGLATDRPTSVMRSANGTIVEVFEWVSADAIAAAHRDPSVQKLWAQFTAICEYRPISEVPEAGELFSEFEALN